MKNETTINNKKKKESRIIQFKGFKLSANKSYYGSISCVEVDHKKKKVRVFAELEKVPEVNFMKSLTYSENYYSPMGTFFRKLGAIDDHGKLNLDNLEGRPVEVTLYKGNDDNWYVNEMFLVEDEAEEVAFDESLDDGYDPDDDDIDFDVDDEE